MQMFRWRISDRVVAEALLLGRISPVNEHLSRKSVSATAKAALDDAT